jgi:hypothetical protein
MDTLIVETMTLNEAESLAAEVKILDSMSEDNIPDNVVRSKVCNVGCFGGGLGQHARRRPGCFCDAHSSARRQQPDNDMCGCILPVLSLGVNGDKDKQQQQQQQQQQDAVRVVGGKRAAAPNSTAAGGDLGVKTQAGPCCQYAAS